MVFDQGNTYIVNINYIIMPLIATNIGSHWREPKLQVFGDYLLVTIYLYNYVQ